MELKELLEKMNQTREEKLNYINEYKKDIKESLLLETFLNKNKGRFIITTWLDGEVLYPHDLMKFKTSFNRELKILIVAGIPFRLYKTVKFNHISGSDDYSFGGLWKESVNIYTKMKIVEEQNENN